MKYLSVCSGIEAATVAWHPLGWEPVGFSEIEPFPSAVLAHHYPHIPNLGDMTKFQEWPLDAGAIDLLVGGTPCQSFSVAGLRQGLRDPRGNLMLTYLAIAARLRPRWVVWENVPGVLSSNGGRDFGSFLGGLVQLGYGVSYRILDAQWCRTHGHPNAQPQRRRRVFVVGCLGDATAAAKVLFERESVLRNSKTRGAAREEIASDVEGRVGAGCWWDGGSAADTLTKCEANGAQRMPDKDNFGAVLQPVPIQDGREINKQQNGIGVGQPGDPAYTLDTTGAQSVYTKAKRAQSDTDDETWVEGQVNPTLSLFDCGDVRATTIAIQGNLIGRDKGGPQGVGASTDGAMYTMTKADVHGVAVAFHPTQDPISSTDGSVHAMGCGSSGGCATQAVAFPINTMTLGGRPDEANDRKMTMGVGADGDPQFTLQAAHSHAVAQAMTVRRLTPRECERLQGFPDDYTLIPWRKKAADDCPDGPRYKALGNSMAVNCMEWIGERIAALEAERGTT
jgi:DNA (cytosine-5)-methyltransferase 1